jgi:hypothetical protein
VLNRRDFARGMGAAQTGFLNALNRDMSTLKKFLPEVS